MAEVPVTSRPSPSLYLRWAARPLRFSERIPGVLEEVAVRGDFAEAAQKKDGKHVQAAIVEIDIERTVRRELDAVSGRVIPSKRRPVRLRSGEARGRCRCREHR